VYRSDVRSRDQPAGIVALVDERGVALGTALWSPGSEIRLRYLAPPGEPVDRDWWVRRLRAAADRRTVLAIDATAYRVVHAEGDGLPSLVVDRYGDVVVVQLLSAGLEAVRDDVLGAIGDVLRPTGLLLRNDASVRRHEGLPAEIAVASGTVPDEIEVREGTVQFLARPRDGQKTGAFLDQRDNHLFMASVAAGRCLDVFTYQGLFALHMRGHASHVQAIDSSAAALAAARANAERNPGGSSIEWVEANAFDHLRVLEQAGEHFDTIVLDPPAFAKTRGAVDRALRGYKELNLRAMRLLRPGGLLLTCSCSYHVTRERFTRMLVDAAQDSGRRVAAVRQVGQALDHPELLTVPETGYLKGTLLRALD
jgi:23S rRNA (cytosine1962-C5)-methyltransferase